MQVMLLLSRQHIVKSAEWCLVTQTERRAIRLIKRKQHVTENLKLIRWKDILCKMMHAHLHVIQQQYAKCACKAVWKVSLWALKELVWSWIIVGLCYALCVTVWLCERECEFQGGGADIPTWQQSHSLSAHRMARLNQYTSVFMIQTQINTSFNWQTVCVCVLVFNAEWGPFVP